MQKKSLVMATCVALALVLALAGVAAAGSFTWSVNGPSEVQQGKSIDLTLTVTASGTFNWKPSTGWPIGFPNPAFTVNSAYIINGLGSGPVTLTSFTRTPRYFTGGPNDGQRKDQDDVSGSATTNLTLTAATDLIPGPYTVVIVASCLPGMDISPGIAGDQITGSVSYPVTVTPGATQPVVTINSPENGSDYLYGTAITFSVSVDQPVDAVLATLDGASFTLDFDSETGNWIGPSLTTLAPGSHIFKALATNSAGLSGDATSSFKVHVNFGQWLPPIFGSNKQMKAGSTLPVKFTIVGVNGPVDDSVAKPHVFLGIKDMGQATSLLDTTTGLPYFQLNIKLPAAGSYQVGVQGDNIVGASMGIITK